MSEKARQELLLPRGRLSSADKAANLKHDPIEEFRASVYRRKDGQKGPTRLIVPANMFKAALRQAAIDMPGGTTKSQIGRTCWPRGTYIDIYGVPMLHMTTVRMANITRTLDVRTRAILPEWCATVTICFTEPVLNAAKVANLLAAAGFLCGIGDFRQEKGAGSFGQFEQVEAGDPKFAFIQRTGGMDAQDAALNAEIPACYDQETENLLAWYLNERERRRGTETVKKPRGRKAASAENGEAAASCAV